MVTTVTGLVTHTVCINKVTPVNTRRQQGGGKGQVAPPRSRHEFQPGECNQRAGGALAHYPTTSPEPNPDTQLSSIQDQNMQPDPNVSQVNLGTTKTGKTRVRRQWTEEINKLLMQCYYSVTNGETDLTAYQNKVWELFKTKYPTWNDITRQNVTSQIRVVKNKTPEMILSNWKRTTTQERNAQEITDHNNDNSITSTTPVAIAPTTTAAATEESNETTNITSEEPFSENTSIPAAQYLINTSTSMDETFSENTVTETREYQITRIHPDPEIIQKFERTLNEFENTDPTKRPKIPKVQYGKRTMETIDKINTILRNHIQNNEVKDLEELGTLIYSAATLVTRELKIKSNIQLKPPKPPTWMTRLNNKKTKYRESIGRLQSYVNGNNSELMLKKIIEICVNNNTNYNDKKATIDLLDTLKQKLIVISNRIKRYTESNNRRKDNKQFMNSESYFYKRITKENTPPEENHSPNNNNPDKEDVKQYWESIWSIETKHNEHAEWIEEEKQRVEHIEEMTFHEVTTVEVKMIIKKLHNWKAPGPDNIQNYWLKMFNAIHQTLAQLISKTLQNPTLMPTYITTGLTYLKPKTEDKSDPSKYRPITCLCTIYKLITSIVTNRINNHITTNKILHEEQKGCVRKSMGCKEQLIIDSVIHEQAIKRKRNLAIAYIDYQKAYDSIPHSWLIHILHIYKIDPIIIKFLEQTMKEWTTTLVYDDGIQTQIIRLIKILKGIFQGDSLSGLWFCLGLNPISTQLRKANRGYTVKEPRIEHREKISHLWFIDDIKMYGENDNDIQHNLNIVKTISDDIKMSFGIDKCRRMTINRGKYEEISQNQPIEGNLTIPEMKQDELYKYLGMKQNIRIDHAKIKDETKKKFYNRLKYILKTKLNSKNITKAINTFAIPILTYTFGIVKWSETDIEEIQRKIRVKLTAARMHHPKSAIERTILKREEGGRGILDIEMLHTGQILNLRKYFQNRAIESTIHKTIYHCDTYTPLQMKNGETNNIKEIRKERRNILIEKWANKKLHGKHRYTITKENIDYELSNEWLKKGTLIPETEGFMLAIQDGVISTRNYRKHILKMDIEDDKCRRCGSALETIEHITGGCQLLAQNQYTRRHDQVATILYKQICAKYNLEIQEEPYYKLKPPPFVENSTHKIYWNKSTYTDHTIKANRPDIILVDKIQKKTSFIEVSVPNNNNIQEKEREKIEKYISLRDEIKHLWKQDSVEIIPIIISSTGVVPKSLKRNCQHLGLPNPIITEIQKATIINTCNIVRSFLN